MMKRKNIVVMIIVAVVTACCAAGTDTGRVHYVVGTPAQVSESESRQITESVIRIVLSASPGDSVRVFDAYRQKPITEIQVPKSRTDRARLRIVSAKIARISAYFQGTDQDPGSHEPRIHLPNFMDTVSSVIDTGMPDVRVLLIGSMYFGDGTDVRFDFRAGTYPSGGHIFATSELSVYGTADKRKLNNTRIDVLNLDPIVDDRDRFYIQRFWKSYAQERGATMTSWQADARLAVEMIQRDLEQPFMDAEIDARDLRREICRVDGPATLPNLWTIVVCVDASASMKEVYEEIRREIPGFAAQMYESGAEIRLAVIPFRSEPLTVFPLTPIRSRGSDGGRSITYLNQYLDRTEVEAAQVEPGVAIRAGMALVESDPSSEAYTCLLLVGDTGPEVNVSDEEKDQLMHELRAWCGSAEGRSFHGVLVGEPHAEGAQYFHDLSAVGEREVVSSFGAVADYIVEQASRVTRGLRPE